MAILSTLRPQKGARKPMKRVGRGDGSGHGGTSTRGHKGQLARSSPHITRGFEGGQMPLHRRSPKWGFTNIGKVTYNVVNLDTLAETFKNGEEVSSEILHSKQILRKKALPLKILGRGELTIALKVYAHSVSKTAREAIEKVKGTITIIPQKHFVKPTKAKEKAA